MDLVEGSDFTMPVVDNARSVAFKSLPPVPENNDPSSTTIVLFYQYIEPQLSKKQHREAMAKVTEIANANGIKGRGRCAPEGLNCTLTGSAEGVRGFCNGLRAWNDVFKGTDFKITDGLEKRHGFKSFGLRKVEELVGYGLSGEKAPVLETKVGVHLEADEYHKMMNDTTQGEDTVIIDVRNAYESAIGHFAPQAGGAKLIDPKMRNSHDWPGWLAKPETQEMLNGKRVMMYCTGGIRCERASALLGEVSAATPGFKPKGIFELRGGIERYIKTFPEGGAWAGKNYVFDRRLVQVPEAKPRGELEKDVGKVKAKCAGCRKPWDVYRGQAKCSGTNVFHGNGLGQPCGVPIILCPSCEARPQVVETAICELCREGYVAPAPSLLDFNRLREAKRKRCEAGAAPEVETEEDRKKAKKAAKKAKKEKGEAPGDEAGSRRVFVGKLPLTVDASMVKAALSLGAAGGAEAVAATGATLAAGAVEAVHWITDKTSGAFYGSCFVQMKTRELAEAAVASYSAVAVASAVGGGSKGQGEKGKSAKKKGKWQKGGAVAGGVLGLLAGKNLRVAMAPPREGEAWPPAGGFSHRERPPVC